MDSNGSDGVREVSREGSFARGEFPKIHLSGGTCVTESGVCVMVRSRGSFSSCWLVGSGGPQKVVEASKW